MSHRELLICLKGAGIMHTNESSAASHIDNIFDDPMKWWNTDSTQDAVKLFNDMCLTDAKDPINSWTNFFNEISSINLKSN